VFPIILILVLSIGWASYVQTGRTPQELFDYIDHSLQSYPSLELLVNPVISILRDWLDLPSLQERRSYKFFIPPAPPLNLALKSITTPVVSYSKGQHRVLHVGIGQPIPTIEAAAKLAKDGDIVEIQSGEYYGDVAVWQQKALIIRGVGGNARLYANGKSAEGKAIWVMRNGNFLVENIEFFYTKVPDKNGAGIRFEQGNLVLRNCLFYGNEDGLVVSNKKETTVDIENSEFAYNGAGDGQSHDIYIGSIKKFSISGSYIHHANIGHLIKSRAAMNIIVYNRITDEIGGRASYEIDLPNGGIARIIGNIIQQGLDIENSTLISYGEEGYSWPNNTLYLINNTVVNDDPFGGSFLRVAPHADKVISANNLFIGVGELHSEDKITSINDVYSDWRIFTRPQRYDYSLNDLGQKLVIPKDQSTKFPELIDLYPREEYLHPRQTRSLTGHPRYPGAEQY
jgi:hypothetical protein